MEHVSAPLGRVLDQIAASFRPRDQYRCEAGLILNTEGRVFSVAQARDLIDLHRQMARAHVDSDGLPEVRAELIGLRLHMIAELQAAIAAAEAYECEPSVKEAAA